VETHFNVVAVFILKAGYFASDKGARFVNIDLVSLVKKLNGGGQAGETAADDGDPELGS